MPTFLVPRTLQPLRPWEIYPELWCRKPRRIGWRIAKWRGKWLQKCSKSGIPEGFFRHPRTGLGLIPQACCPLHTLRQRIEILAVRSETGKPPFPIFQTGSGRWNTRSCPGVKLGRITGQIPPGSCSSAGPCPRRRRSDLGGHESHFRPGLHQPLPTWGRRITLSMVNRAGWMAGSCSKTSSPAPAIRFFLGPPPGPSHPSPRPGRY